jgi:hypothetical protein
MWQAAEYFSAGTSARVTAATTFLEPCERPDR